MYSHRVPLYMQHPWSKTISCSISHKHCAQVVDARLNRGGHLFSPFTAVVHLPLGEPVQLGLQHVRTRESYVPSSRSEPSDAWVIYSKQSVKPPLGPFPEASSPSSKHSRYTHFMHHVHSSAGTSTMRTQYHSATSTLRKLLRNFL